MLAEGGPGLLAVDDVVVTVADRGGLQAREVGAGAGLGEALGPPDVEVGGLGEEAVLELVAAEVGDDGPDHAGVERQGLGDAGPLELIGVDVGLGRGPVLSAVLDRPVGNGHAVLVEHLLGVDDVLAGDLASAVTVADLFRDFPEDGAQVVAERDLLRCELQIHPCYSSRCHAAGVLRHCHGGYLVSLPSRVNTRNTSG